MADSTNNGQINFGTDLSALNQFINSLQNFVNQSNSADPQIQRLTKLFNELNTTIVKLNGSFESFNKSSNIQSMGQVENYVKGLVSVMARLDVEFKQLAGSNQSMSQILSTFRELNKVVNTIGKITTKLGSPEDVARMQTSFASLLGMIQNLVTEINKLDMSSNNFDKLNNVLKNLSQTMGTVSRSGSQMSKNVNNSAEGIRTVGIATNATSAHVKNYASVFSGAFGENPFSMLTKLHMGVNNLRFGFEGLMVSLGGRELWNWLIGTNQQIEVLQASLEVTLKSAEKAEDAIRSLRSYAALTPFQEMETFQAGEMLAANRMDIDKWIRVAGDLASAKRTAGVELNDVINVLTRVNSGDFGKAMIRLRQMGISLNDLREKGLEFTKNNTYKGSTDQMLSALDQIVEERYGGLTEKLGTTTEGLISTVKDFFLQLGIQMGDVSFRRLRDWLKTIKQDLQDFQSSAQFRKMISGFNEFMDGMIGFLKPFADVLGKIGMFLANNLPLIGKLLQMFITFSTIKLGFNLAENLTKGIANISANWININREADIQVALLKKEGVELNKNAITLAKINALRKAGTTIIAEETVAQSVQNEMAAVGGISNVAGAKNFIGPLTKTQAMATGLGAFASKLGALAPEIMIAVMAIQMLGFTVDSLSNSIRKHDKQVETSSDDWDRQIGQAIETQKALEDLNSSRVKASDTIKYYADLQERANSTQTQGAFNDAQRANITNKLNDAKQHLVRIDEQIMEISPDLVSALTDETGALTDQTDAFNLNTDAILNNINQKKIAIDEMHKSQVASAKTENDILNKQIKDDKNQLKKANSKAYQWAGAILGPVDDVTMGFGSKLAHNLGLMSDDTYKALDLIKHPEDIASSKLKADSDRYEAQIKINKNKTIISEDEQAKEAGFETTVKDAKGKSRKIIDWEGYRAYLKQKDDELAEYQKKLTPNPQTYVDEVSAADEEIKRISKGYDSRLKQELVKNGNDTGTEAYKNIEKEKAKAISDYIDTTISDISEIHDSVKQVWDDQLNRVSGSLKSLLDSNLDPEEIITALSAGNAYIETHYKGRQLIIDNLENLLKDLKKKHMKPKDLRQTLGEYETIVEANKVFNDSINALKIEKADAQLDTVKSKTSALQSFNDKWNQEKEQMELKKDIALQKDQLAGFDEGSAKYEADKKAENMSIYNFLTKEIAALQNAINKGVISGAKEKYQAQTQLLQLDKDRNALLLDIKKNTSKLDEFNKPSQVKAITYYDYKAKDASASTIEIGDARFVMQVQSLQTIDDVRKMMDTVKKYLGDYIKTSESNGSTIQNNYT